MAENDQEHESFYAAYEAYQKVHASLLHRFRVAVRGGPYDMVAAALEAEEMDRLHVEFMQMAEPFVRRGKP